MPQTKQRHTEYMRNYRLKHTDNIQKHEKAQVDRVKHINREPCEPMREPCEPYCEPLGANAWDSEPKPKRNLLTNQQILRELDPTHCE